MSFRPGIISSEKRCSHPLTLRSPLARSIARRRIRGRSCGSTWTATAPGRPPSRSSAGPCARRRDRSTFLGSLEPSAPDGGGGGDFPEMGEASQSSKIRWGRGGGKLRLRVFGFSFFPLWDTRRLLTRRDEKRPAGAAPRGAESQQGPSAGALHVPLGRTSRSLHRPSACFASFAAWFYTVFVALLDVLYIFSGDLGKGRKRIEKLLFKRLKDTFGNQQFSSCFVKAGCHGLLPLPGKWIRWVEVIRRMGRLLSARLVSKKSCASFGV